MLSHNEPELILQALEGKRLTQEEATSLLAECPTESLLRVASILRDKVKPRVVTYSRKVFLSVVNLCRDSCSYCTYKKEPFDSGLSMMKPGEIMDVARMGKKLRCTEALVVTGERPEQRYSSARTWLAEMGYTSLVEYLVEVCDQVFHKAGLFPHTNAGTLTKKEMSLLKNSNASLGVMLETASERLMEPGMPHENAPSKHPKARLGTLRSAGELSIPMTTGLLVGIGENSEELVESLLAIRRLSEDYGHIQEVIMQNFAPKAGTAMSGFPASNPDYFIRTVALSRILMPSMNIQVPPNLSPDAYGRYISAGINDWGGISPYTPDYVNPEFAWPPISEVKNVTSVAGRQLRARLPVYPEFLSRGLLPAHMQDLSESLVDSEGLVKEEYVNAN